MSHMMLLNWLENIMKRNLVLLVLTEQQLVLLLLLIVLLVMMESTAKILVFLQ